MSGGGRRASRTTAEWVTFGVSVLILAVLVGLIVRDWVVHEQPAAPVAKVAGPVRHVGNQFFVPVDVENLGDLTATEVVVKARLRVGEDTVESDHTIQQVAGSATEELELVLPKDPATGTLTVQVTGFQRP